MSDKLHARTLLIALSLIVVFSLLPVVLSCEQQLSCSPCILVLQLPWRVLLAVSALLVRPNTSI